MSALLLIGLGLGLMVGMRQIAALGDVRHHLPAFYVWFGVAFGCYVATLGVVARLARASLSRRRRGLLLALIGLAALSARLCLWPMTPTLSDDIYRYCWDGRVQQAGLDPYRYPPNADALAFLRQPQDALINFPHLRTVYPPVTQQAFHLGAWLGGSLRAQKAVFIAAEWLTVLGLWLVLRRRRLSSLWLLAYLWHPLVLLEISGSGHNDALGVGLLWLGVAAWEMRRPGAAALVWGAAFLAKFVSAVLVPWWWFRRQARWGLIVFGVTALLPWVGYPSAPAALVESLSAMGGRFASNASVTDLLVWLTGHLLLSRAIAFVALAGFLLWWAWRCADPVRYLGGVLGAAALLTPVLHPWYLLWLVPCFCFWRPAWLVALTGTVVLSYLVWPGRLADGRWVLPLWAHVLEYAPVLVLGGWEVRRWMRPSSSRLAMKPAPSARC